jgi:excisionase family DNA binding protein
MSETLLTVTEAAAQLGVSQSAIRNATLDGRLASTVRYGRKLIATGDLEAYRRRSQPDGQPSRGRPRKVNCEKESPGPSGPGRH